MKKTIKKLKKLIDNVDLDCYYPTSYEKGFLAGLRKALKIIKERQDEKNLTK